MLWTEERVVMLVEENFDSDRDGYIHEPVAAGIVRSMIRQVRNEYEAKIAELESKLATATEPEEAHFLEIDRLTEALNDSRQRDIARF